tara:strand:- start:46 stop:699 length:654 start_codon:yes stop_codon:yes gene_type:complete
MKKINVYLMPGMAANSKIFEYIRLPEIYQIHKLDWIIPKKNETLKFYAKRICKKIDQPDPILIGVSFGGILIQEVSKYLNYKKIVIISSIKTNEELPISMKMAKKTKIHKILPFKWINNIDKLALFAFGDGIKKKVKLYQKYLSYKDPNYLKWAMDCIVNWDQKEIIKEIIHIHGKKDNVFPVKNLSGRVYLIEGNHAIIITRANQINKLLIELLKN